MRKVFKGFSLLFIISILLLLYFPSISKFFGLKHQEELLNHDIADLKIKIEELRNEARLIKTDVAHLEQVMRKELGLVKPGEVVYKLVPTASLPAEVKTEKTDKVEDKSLAVEGASLKN